MTIDDVKSKIDKIKELSWDAENAHLIEDGLYTEFINHVANIPTGVSVYELSVIARELLKTKNIKFGRHCS